jgi:putative FmdB family regulatory protein
MITYEYKCQKCGHTFEAEQRMTDKPLSACPKCKGRVDRLIGGGMAAFVKKPAAAGCPNGGSSPGCRTCPHAAGRG